MIPQPGSRGTDWRPHAPHDPAASRFTELELTDSRGAERFSRARLQAGDVALGDRFLAKAGDLDAVRAQGADFIVRVGWSSLRLTPTARKDDPASLSGGWYHRGGSSKRCVTRC